MPSKTRIPLWPCSRGSQGVTETNGERLKRVLTLTATPGNPGTQQFRKADRRGHRFLFGLNELEQIREPEVTWRRFFFVDVAFGFDILSAYMARIFSLRRKPTLALRHRKAVLLRQLKVLPDFLRASFVERFSVC